MIHVVTPPPTEASYDQIVWLAGPRLVGLLLNWWLLGVLTTQLYIYHVSFSKDTRLLKALVYGIYILDWVQTCSATYDGFQWFVYGWGNVPMLFGRFTGFLNVPFLSSLIGVIVQASSLSFIFYGWRIWIFSRSKVLFAIVVLLALLQFGGGLGSAYFMFMDASETARPLHLLRCIGIRLAGTAVVDAVISVSMTYFLLRGGAQALDPIKNVTTRLVRLTVETGTFTVVTAIVDLVFFLREHNGLHQVTGVILCKLYSNTFMALLNNRLVVDSEKIRQVISGERGVSIRVDRVSKVDRGEFKVGPVHSDKEYTPSIDSSLAFTGGVEPCRDVTM
ncbi:hypothetical protein B0H19DRAFT_1271690 [Mycena capillaripes]|nr:hypothetical protein B0H19DRAFT_1271690 [Mycena capillaripes]